MTSLTDSAALHATDVADLPLCIDLDGTLVRSDTLVEAAIELLKENPAAALAMPLWLLHGKAHLKARIAERVSLAPASLPYRDELLQWIREQSQLRPVYLVSAAHHSIADSVAAHLGCFSGVIATHETNLSAENKASALRERFGSRGFDYAGNSSDDLVVWKEARRAVLVGTSAAVAKKACSEDNVDRVFDPPVGLLRKMRLWLRALRVYQWVKNLLVFLAPFAAHSILQPHVLKATVMAFFAFSFAASAVYLFNDLFDLPSDRAHQRKRLRPFARGDLPVLSAVATAPLLLAASIAISLSVGLRFFVVMACYVVVTTAYSAGLKRLIVVDVAILAALYTVRVVAGAAANDFDLSFWLLAMCAYGFFSLALLKRYGEMTSAHEARSNIAPGRGYVMKDLPVVLALGAGAGLVATLVMALYLDSQSSRALYSNPQYLWTLVALMTIGLARLWMVAGRGEMHDDPIVFVARDRFSLALIAAATITVFFAI